MVAVTRLCYTSPVNNFFQWVGQNAPCSGLASEAFRRTVVQKLDDEDQPKQYFNDPVTGAITRLREPAAEGVRTFTDLTYIEDIETGDLYFAEPRHVIAGKCIDIVLGTPLYFLVNEVWNVFKTIILVSFLTVDTIKQCAQEACKGDLAAMGSAAWKGVWNTGAALGEGITDIVRAPFYAIGVEFAALYGIVDQYRGRKWIAAIEHSWQKGVSYRDDRQQYTAPGPDEPCWPAAIRDIKKARTFYLANCFQVRGNTHDPKIRVVPA